jgi:esterase/lipase superfamily enzyme
MNIEHHKWYSHRLGRDMETLVFGHGGAPVIVFPTSYSHFQEWKDQRMVDWLADKIDGGLIQLYCVDSVAAETWYNKAIHPHYRSLRHNQWEDYIVNEYYPFIRSKNSNWFTILTGTSFGAFLAVNFALKHPDLANKVVAMSGGYDTSGLFQGYHDEDTYFNSPLEYVPNLHDYYQMEKIKRIDMKLVTSDHDIGECRETTLALSQKLWDKGIWHQCDVWQPNIGHDWPFWYNMVRTYL